MMLVPICLLLGALATVLSGIAGESETPKKFTLVYNCLLYTSPSPRDS